MPKTKIAVVIVTYGERWKLLEEVLKVIIDDVDVCKVVLVDNASVNNLEIDYFVNRHFFKTELIRNESNLGSSGGFAQGIKYTKILGCEFVLLLDDDSILDKDFVNKYLNDFKKLNSPKVAILGNKKSSNENIFFNEQDKNKFKEVEGFSYNGLFMSKQAVNDVPLPDEQLLSYGDDMEYGFNLIKAGYKIYDTTSEVIKNLNEENKKSFKEDIFSKDTSSFKVFLKTRNMVILYLRNTNGLTLSARLNIIRKFIGLCFYGFSKSGINGFTFKRLSFIRTAIHRGIISNFEIPKNIEIRENVVV